MQKKQSYFSWGRIVLISLIVASTEIMWTLYNTYVPIWLQAGNPNFVLSSPNVIGFGFGAFVTGIILTLDNIAALFISPLFGFLSDSTRSRFGRRKPWIVFSAPVAIIAFVFIPIFVLRIPPELNGQAAQLTSYLIPFVIVIAAMVLPLAIMRTPANVIAYDITPSKHRTMVSAVASFVGAFAGIAGAIIGAILFDIHPGIPFWIAAAFSSIVIALVAVRITEPPIAEVEDLQETKKSSWKETLNGFRSLPKESSRSLLFLFLSVFLSYFAFAQLQSFSSSYGVSVLGMDVGTSGMLYAAGGMAFIVAALPTGFVAKRLNRKPTAIIGFVIFAIMGLVIYLVPNEILVWVSLAIGGFFWAFVWVPQDPLVMDAVPNDKLLGSLGGILAATRTLGYIVGPIAGGFFVEKFGNNYNNIWLVLMVGSILGALALLPVTKGEVKPETDADLENYLEP